MIRDRFPDVVFVTIENFQKEKPNRLVLDVRSADEYALSHMEGAVRFATWDADQSPKDTPITLYCSVGYRSAEAAQQLAQLGFTNVQNLEGSLFEWANLNLPMVNDQGSTSLVHPYDAKWGCLLLESHRAPLP